MKAAFVAIWILFAFSSAFASELEGSWKYVSRSCLSGAKPNPTVEEPRSTTIFRGDTMTIRGEDLRGCEYLVGPARVSVANGEIVPLDTKTRMEIACDDQSHSTGEALVEKLNYVMSEALLRITTMPSQWDGQTCPKGDSQVLQLERAGL